MSINQQTYYQTFRFFIIDLVVFLQTADKLKIELEKNNINIIAVEGFEQRGDLSFQMDKLKVKIYVLPYKRWCHGGLHDQTPKLSKDPN